MDGEGERVNVRKKRNRIVIFSFLKKIVFLSVNINPSGVFFFFFNGLRAKSSFYEF